MWGAGALGFLAAAVALAAAIRATVREWRQQAAAERQDATPEDSTEDEDPDWWREDEPARAQPLPAALAVASVAGACEETLSDLWANWPSGAFRAAMGQGEIA